MMTTTMRFFNTAGPIKAEMHYHISPLARLDCDDLLQLIRQEKYFVLPRAAPDRQDLRAPSAAR